MANSQDVADLKAARSSLVAVVRDQAAAWAAAGCPPTFSVDGESYDWSSWLKAKSDEIRGLTELINSMSSPWVVRSRGRA